jgi:serpin B
MRTITTLLLVASLARAGEADEAFAFELFSRVAARDGNVACSPLSVRVALAMAYGGARGPTAEEMARVLRCDEGIHAGLAALVKAYDGREGMPALADAAWVREGAGLLPAYLDLVRKHYGAAPAAIDFRAADAAAGQINAWVTGRRRSSCPTPGGGSRWSSSCRRRARPSPCPRGSSGRSRGSR